MKKEILGVGQYFLNSLPPPIWRIILSWYIHQNYQKENKIMFQSLNERNISFMFSIFHWGGGRAMFFKLPPPSDLKDFFVVVKRNCILASKKKTVFHSLNKRNIRGEAIFFNPLIWRIFCFVFHPLRIKYGKSIGGGGAGLVSLKNITPPHEILKTWTKYFLSVEVILESESDSTLKAGDGGLTVCTENFLSANRKF